LLRDPAAAKAEAGPRGAATWDYSGVVANTPRYALLFLGMGGVAMASSAFLVWVPTIVSREFGWSSSKAGSAYGAILLVLSPMGLFLGGWLSDLLVSRGRTNAYSFGVGLAPSAPVLFAVLAVTHFALCFALGSTPAYIQIITPKHARGQVSAVYVLVLNVLGLGAGPMLVGSLSSLSAQDPHALRAAVIAVIIPALALAAVLLTVLVWWEHHRGQPALTVPTAARSLYRAAPRPRAPRVIRRR
jgi:MFS family permease